MDFNYILGSSDTLLTDIIYAYLFLVQPLILYLLLGVMADVQNLEKQFKEFSIQNPNVSAAPLITDILTPVRH